MCRAAPSFVRPLRDPCCAGVVFNGCLGYDGGRVDAVVEGDAPVALSVAALRNAGDVVRVNELVVDRVPERVRAGRSRRASRSWWPCWTLRSCGPDGTDGCGKLSVAVEDGDRPGPTARAGLPSVEELRVSGEFCVAGGARERRNRTDSLSGGVPHRRCSEECDDDRRRRQRNRCRPATHCSSLRQTEAHGSGRASSSVERTAPSCSRDRNHGATTGPTAVDESVTVLVRAEAAHPTVDT